MFGAKCTSMTNFSTFRLSDRKHYLPAFFGCPKIVSNCDECLIFGQNVFLGTTIQLPDLGCSPESHHLRLFIEVCCSRSMLFPSDKFSKPAVIPIRFPRSEFAVTLASSRPEDTFFDLTANWILGAIILSIPLKIAFFILSSTASTILPNSLSIHSLKHLHNVWTSIVFSLLVETPFYQQYILGRQNRCWPYILVSSACSVVDIDILITIS